MDMQSALATRIEAAGTIAGDRVHWVAVPQGTALPYIRMQTASVLLSRTEECSCP